KAPVNRLTNRRPRRAGVADEVSGPARRAVRRLHEGGEFAEPHEAGGGRGAGGADEAVERHYGLAFASFTYSRDPSRTPLIAAASAASVRSRTPSRANATIPPRVPFRRAIERAARIASRTAGTLS